MAETATEGFVTALKGYHNSATFSDAVIRCGNKEFKTHRLVLSSHSGFFVKMCTGKHILWVRLTGVPYFQESETGIITLEEADERVVEAMVYFLYHFDYSNTQGISSMVFNAQMYSLADRYMIAALKHIAKEKFETAIKTGWAMDDFLLAITDVYESTPEDDRGLRDLVLDVSHTNLGKLLENARFQELLRDTPRFAAEMVSYGPEKSRRDAAERYRCPSCTKVNILEWQRGSYFYCAHCNSRRSDWGSYQV
ncbi:hypothetical protein B0T14DRAFT_532219 [Immersiella caudata]|uniref:BTB domain-containing protein n=1 Tax=Immersiella caudata TaxID=314043 RepID=A0AA39XD69_9PEZI|nr:hypothetical protein B0T14DRAFT_532219 [Immersiella caudata]